MNKEQEFYYEFYANVCRYAIQSGDQKLWDIIRPIAEKYSVNILPQMTKIFSNIINSKENENEAEKNS